MLLTHNTIMVFVAPPHTPLHDQRRCKYMNLYYHGLISIYNLVIKEENRLHSLKLPLIFKEKELRHKAFYCVLSCIVVHILFISFYLFNIIIS